MDTERTANINIGGEEFTLLLTTKATKEIAARYGGLENLGDKLMKSENFEMALDEIVWLITLLANQSILVHNLQHPDDRKPELTAEAVELLQKSGQKFDYPVKWGIDLQTEHERFLTEQEFKRPVFVTDYPKEIKAFYMKLNEDGKTVAAMDCLVPGIGEIIGGSQREDDLGLLEKRMDELGLNKEDYAFYLDLRKYGSARHAGFGLGFERCVMYLTGMGNIRDVIPFPRTVNNCEL